jgi:hypothetical protein
MNEIAKLAKCAAAAALVSAFSVAPASAATGLSFSNLSGAEYDTAGVFVLGDYSYTADTDDGGGFDQVQFQLWDDGVVKFQQTSSLAVGSSGTFHFESWYAGLVLQGAQGVGLVLNDIPGGWGDVIIDPYNVPHYSDPSQCQRDCGPVGAVPEPETYAMLMAGLGLIGLMGRRRKQSAA